MEYLAVQWKHNLPEMPIEIFSELDALRLEKRKVELFRDGSYGFASEMNSRGPTRLGIEPVPLFHEIASEPEFVPRRIDANEFGALWQRATAK